MAEGAGVRRRGPRRLHLEHDRGGAVLAGVPVCCADRWCVSELFRRLSERGS